MERWARLATRRKNEDVSLDEGNRFPFGENWIDFNRTVGGQQLLAAREALTRLFDSDDLTGKTFLDVGCGSGLHALAAHQLGATVTAFDFDQHSVRATVLLRDRHAGSDAYPVHQGSVLDRDFLHTLGRHDLVYSWGVLHHTGAMWMACQNVVDLVADGGSLAIALYNDQGLASEMWTRVKRAYVMGGPRMRRIMVTLFGAYFATRSAVAHVVKGQRVSERPRGMDRRHDLVDWVGGYPFEVAKPEEVFRFFHTRGFELGDMTTCAGGLGCNEFRFDRNLR